MIIPFLLSGRNYYVFISPAIVDQLKEIVGADRVITDEQY